MKSTMILSSLVILLATTSSFAQQGHIKIVNETWCSKKGMNNAYIREGHTGGERACVRGGGTVVHKQVKKFYDVIRDHDDND